MNRLFKTAAGLMSTLIFACGAGAASGALNNGCQTKQPCTTSAHESSCTTSYADISPLLGGCSDNEVLQALIDSGYCVKAPSDGCSSNECSADSDDQTCDSTCAEDVNDECTTVITEIINNVTAPLSNDSDCSTKGCEPPCTDSDCEPCSDEECAEDECGGDCTDAECPADSDCGTDAECEYGSCENADEADFGSMNSIADLLRSFGITAVQRPAEPIINTEPQSDSDEITEAATGTSAYEAEVAALVNDIRREYGLQELELDTALCGGARAKSADMHDNGYFSHNSPVYGSPFDMMRGFGITYRTAGENIAMGYRTPQDVVNGWMNSEGHRANILNPSFTKIGVGCIEDGYYWTQWFVG